MGNHHHLIETNLSRTKEIKDTEEALGNNLVEEIESKVDKIILFLWKDNIKDELKSIIKNLSHLTQSHGTRRTCYTHTYSKLVNYYTYKNKI